MIELNHYHFIAGNNIRPFVLNFSDYELITSYNKYQEYL